MCRPIRSHLGRDAQESGGVIPERTMNELRSLPSVMPVKTGIQVTSRRGCSSGFARRFSDLPRHHDLDSMSSQTKCNTLLARCCDGNEVRTAVIGGPVPDCRTSRPRPLGPANRARSGSRAVDGGSGTEAQQRPHGRLQAHLCQRTGAGAAPSKSPDVWRKKPANPSSATKPSTASSTRRLPEPRTTAGASISRAPKANAAGAAGRGQSGQLHHRPRVNR